MCFYIKIAQLHTVDQPSNALEIEKNDVKAETLNNEVEPQKRKDRKVHYAIG